MRKEIFTNLQQQEVPVPEEILNMIQREQLTELRRYVRRLILERCNRPYYWGVGGSGMIFVCPEDQTVYLQRRSWRVTGGQGQWGFPGGGLAPHGHPLDHYDTPIDDEYMFGDSDPYFLEHALEEVEEECGSIPQHQVIRDYMYDDCGFKYKTFIAIVSLTAKEQWNPQPQPQHAWEIIPEDSDWYTMEEFDELDASRGRGDGLFFGFTPDLTNMTRNAMMG